jgi:hypothetical protein
MGARWDADSESWIQQHECFECGRMVDEGNGCNCTNDLDDAVACLDCEAYTAPSAWASYLINGDESGIDDDEMNAADAWLDSIDLGSPVDASDAGFIRHHDAYEFMPLGSDCQLYTFYRS